MTPQLADDRNQDRLTEAEARCRAILDAVADAVLVHDHQRILDVSAGFVRLLGYTAAEALTLDPAAILSEEDRDRVRAAERDGTMEEFSATAVRKDSARLTVRWLGRPLGCSARVVVLREETPRLLAEEQVLALNARLAQKVHDFETLFNVAPVGIGVAEDRECQVIHLNPAFAAMLGCTPEENASKTGPLAATLPFEVWKDGKLVEGRDLPMQVAARDGRVVLNYEEDIVRADGVTIHGLLQAAPLYAENGEIRGAIGVLLDITERKRAEEALAAREREFRAIFEHAGDGHAQADGITGRFLRVNRKLCDLTGYSEQELLQKTFYDLTHPDDRRLNQEWLERAMRGEIDGYELEKRYVRKDGEVMWIHVSVGVIRDPSGRLLQTVASIRNITVRKRAEAERDAAARELEMQRARLQAVLEQMPAGVIIAEAPSGRLVLGNHQVETIWRRPFLPAPYISHYAAYRGYHADGRLYRPEEWPLARAILTGETVSGEEIDFLRGDGTRGTMICSAAPIRGASGDVVAAAAVFSDVTELKQARLGLQRSNEQLQQFAYAAAHDLNEPLRNIVVFAQLMQRQFSASLGAEGNELLSVMTDSAQRMQTLINDLLSYTRAVGPDSPALERCDCNQALRDVLDALETQIRDSGAEITMDPLPHVSLRRAHLVQVFQNLVSNAIKYRRPDRPLRIDIRADSDPGDWITFTVEDNGLGVAEPWREQIFGVFQRLHGREVPGTGIGLAICRRIVSHYGGRIWVESAASGGSRFRFTLPGAPGGHAA